MDRTTLKKAIRLQNDMEDLSARLEALRASDPEYAILEEMSVEDLKELCEKLILRLNNELDEKNKQLIAL